MNRPAQYEELTLLLSRLIDVGLTAEERRQLDEMLQADTGARMLYMQYMDLQVELSCLVPAATAAVQAAPPRRKPFSRRALMGLAGAAAIIAILASWLTMYWRQGKSPTVATRLTDVRGTVRVGEDAASASLAAAQTDLTSGQRIHTVGEDSSAVIEFADRSRLVLHGDTMVILRHTEPKQVEVLAGVLVATVAPQSVETPMLVTTPRADVRVLGTEFALAASSERTDLRVSEGRVKLTRKPDGASVEVTPGKFVRAEPGGSLAVDDVDVALDRWDIDLESGLPEGWQQGEWTANGLPSGSRGAVRTAARAEPGASKPWHGIASSKGWITGLFAIHDDSTLHFTFKMDRPGWMQVLLVTRSSDLKSPKITVYSVSPRTLGSDRGWWDVPSGTWQTAHIPLAGFKRLPDIGPPPATDVVPFQIVFSSQDRDRGFVIDRMWVSRGQPEP
jgi:ferric-dicitrate binding protein FerR (iron transport regulator)